MWKMFVFGGPVMATIGSAFLVLAATGEGSPAGYVSIAVLSAGVSALGVVLSGKIVVPTFAYNREKERADKWETEVLRLQSAIADRHVPALDAAAHAVNDSTDVLKRALEVLVSRKP